MKQRLFKQIETSVKASTVEKIIDAICSTQPTTRAEIAERSGVGLTTVYRVTQALIDSGLVSDRVKTATDGMRKRPCGHLSVTRRLCTAVIDLSSPVYSIDLICGGERYFHSTHKYDSSVCFEDNLFSFLSRAFSKLRLKENYALQICVIHADYPAPSTASQTVLPTVFDKSIIDNAIYDVCKRIPQLYVSKSQAVASAVKYNVVGKADGFGGASYLHIGSVLFGFSVLPDGHVLSCKPAELIFDNNLTVGEIAQRCITKNDFKLLLEKTVNYINSTFGAQILIIESDSFEIDSLCIKELSRKYTTLHLPMPIVYPIHSGEEKPSVLTLAAARKSEAEFIKSHVLK